VHRKVRLDVVSFHALCWRDSKDRQVRSKLWERALELEQHDQDVDQDKLPSTSPLRKQDSMRTCLLRSKLISLVVLGISCGLLVLAAPLRCAVCAGRVQDVHLSRQQRCGGYMKSNRRGGRVNWTSGGQGIAGTAHNGVVMAAAS
jgi:hypothetical protein